MNNFIITSLVDPIRMVSHKTLPMFKFDFMITCHKHFSDGLCFNLFYEVIE
jgi:hypothetical protein